VEEDAGAGGERKACVRRAATGRHASARIAAPLFRRDEEGRRGADVTHWNCCRRILSLSTSPRRAAPIAASGPWRERWAHRASGAGSAEVAGGVSLPAAGTQSGGARDAGAPTFRRSPSAESAPTHHTPSPPVALQTDEAHPPVMRVAGAARGPSPCGGAAPGR
jgi:hypothetical protein